MNKISNVVNGEFRRNGLIRIIEKVQAWNEKRIAVRQLNAMSDRLLHDIGIERYEISEAVRKPASFTPLAANRPESSKIYDYVRRAA